MTSLLSGVSLGLLVLQILVTGLQGQSEDLQSKRSLRSMEEKETVLPCSYQWNGSVVQVTWFKINSDQTKEQMITAHSTEGQFASGKWATRVRFSSHQPTVDSTLVIISTAVSDEGDYICRISTFPSGNFDIEMSLTVWTIPISSVDPVIVREGESFRQVASCRSVAHPPPKLSWDTELNGQHVNRTSDKGAVSTHFSLYPMRNLNGKKLDCLVWHPVFPNPRRIANRLVVHYPPNAEVSGYSDQWHVGMENAFLKCIFGGNPEPTLTWTRSGGDLPTGAVPHPDGRLVFVRPLNSSDAGTYQCLVKNSEGEVRAEATVALGEPPKGRVSADNMMMFVVGGAAGVLLIVMLIVVILLTCHHKRKNKKLKDELTVKKEEISTLSRQASVRRVNSVSTEAREFEENIPLRVEGTLRNSLSSLGEQAHCRDSRSTVSGGRGGGGPPIYDSLGRPYIYNSSRRGRDRPMNWDRPMDREAEARIRVEQYVRNSNMSSQDPLLHPPLLKPTYTIVHANEAIRQMNGSAVIQPDGGSHSGSAIRGYQPPPMSCAYPPVTYDEDEIDEGLGGPASQEHPDDQDSEASSLNFSKNRMSPQAHNHNPHTSYVHKAQIV